MEALEIRDHAWVLNPCQQLVSTEAGKDAFFCGAERGGYG